MWQILATFGCLVLVKRSVRLQKGRIVKKAIKVVLLFLTTIVGIPALCLWIDYTQLHSAEFDPKTWATNQSNAPRVTMAGSLMRRLKNNEYDRSGVRDLLGNPAYGNKDDSEWGYRVGATTFGLHDLIVRFDGKGHVRDVRLWRL